MRDIVKFQTSSFKAIIIHSLDIDSIKKGIDIIHEKPGYFDEHCSGFILDDSGVSYAIGQYTDNLRNKIESFYAEKKLTINKQKKLARVCELIALVNEKNKQLDEFQADWMRDKDDNPFDEVYDLEVEELEKCYLELADYIVLK